MKNECTTGRYGNAAAFCGFIVACGAARVFLMSFACLVSVIRFFSCISCFDIYDRMFDGFHLTVFPSIVDIGL